jgi:hypothetical protein
MPPLRKAVVDLLREGEPDLLIGFGKGEVIDDLETEFVVYQRRKQPPWTSDPALESVVHHVCVLSAYENVLAIFTSEDRLDALLESAVAEGDPAVFKKLEVIPPALLNAAFVKGDAQTLWLTGTHRRTSTKPDRKVLSGIVLQDALDPLDDQSFYFTAARCRMPDASGKVIGVSPRKSTGWIGLSKTWADYRAAVVSTCSAIQEVSKGSGTDSPLPFLASPVSIDPMKLGDAFEMSVLSNSDADVPTEDVAKAQTTPPFSVFFEILKASPPDLEVKASLDDGTCWGRFQYSLAKVGDRAVWDIEALDNEASQAESLSRLLTRSPDLKVWFENGFLIAGGSAFETKFRDVPFGGFRWSSFSGFDVTTEKPIPLSSTTVGTKKSLFCWVKSRWADGGLDWLDKGGWLACNDGALEIADFIHLSAAPVPTLTLIHVKAAKAPGNARSVRVTPYEVVTSQAMKNLRFVDDQLVRGEFGNGLASKLNKAVWLDGKPADRGAMIAAINGVGSRVLRQVVVVQPHTRQSDWAKASASSVWTERRRLQQLHTLLNAAQNACTALNTRFFVVGDSN